MRFVRDDLALEDFEDSSDDEEQEDFLDESICEICLDDFFDEEQEDDLVDDDDKEVHNNETIWCYKWLSVLRIVFTE